MTVIAYVDKHPDLSQDAIVKHFLTCVEGILIFYQSTLSQKLKSRMLSTMSLAVEEMPHGNDISGGAMEWRGMYIRPYINNNN